MSLKRQLVSSATPWEAMAGYSRALRIGQHVYVSGTTASDESGAVQHPGDAAGQAAYILRKIERALQALDASLDDVVRTRVFVRNIEDWEAVARTHGQFFATIRPATTLVRAEMIDERMLVEIEAEAMLAF